jgi:hypothetical protein
MKKLLCTVLAVGGLACHSAPPNTRVGDVAPGAPTPSVAVKEFFDAVHAGDLQAMSLVWGTSKGPTRETIPPAELEKREVILQCYFNADSYGIGDGSNNVDGHRVFNVSLVRGQTVRTTNVTTVRGPGDRWYVEKLDVAAVRDFCGRGLGKQP